MNRKTITRRGFLKAAAVGTAGMAAFGLMDLEALTAMAERKDKSGDANTLNNTAANPFDFEKRTVLLNNGVEMPIVGLGTFCLSRRQAEDSTYWALKAGHRLIDTAYAYGNEAYVGKGIHRALDEGIVRREEIFVTTKLWPDGGYTDEAIDNALAKMDLDYIDLMLLHQPQQDYIGGYQAMERAVEQGKLRCIGVSNFNAAQMEEIRAIAKIIPAVNQIETHLYNQQQVMSDYLKKTGVVMESWFPLGGRTNAAEFLALPQVQQIAAAHNKLPVQVIIRWHLQSGYVCFPGSTNETHIQENLDVFDFELTADEMALLGTLNRNAPYFQGLGETEEETREIMDGWEERWGLSTTV